MGYGIAIKELCSLDVKMCSSVGDKELLERTFDISKQSSR